MKCKKFICSLVVVVLMLTVVACSSPQQTDKDNTSPSETVSEKIDIKSLKADDEVTIVGQKANSTLVNNDTIWVQVQIEDATFVIYHCQLKDEYLETAGGMGLSQVVKVKGKFLSLIDVEAENTSPIVNLYDCELLK